MTAPPKLMISQAMRKLGAVLQAENSERADEAHRGAEQPAGAALPCRGGERAGQRGRRQAETEQP